MRRPRFVETRPRVGHLAPGHQVEQRRLAVAVAADDADPLALPDPEADLVEQDADAVGLGDLLQVEQVGRPAIRRTPRRGRRRPARWRRGRPAARPRSSAARDSSAASCVFAMPTTVGPEPESITRVAAVRLHQRRSVSASSGRRLIAACSRSLRIEAARASASPAFSAEIRPRGSPRCAPAGYVGVQPVELAVHRGRREADVARHDHPPVRPAVGNRRDQLAAPDALRAAADQGERHVAAELGGDREQVVVGGAQVPQPVERDQGRGGVGAAAGQSAGDRDALADLDVGREVEPVVRGEQPPGADGDVGLVERYVGDVDLADRLDAHAPLLGRGDAHVVVQADRLVDGVERVEAVLARTADDQGEVDLRGSADGDAHPGRGELLEVIRGPRRSARSRRGGSCSPRVIGSTPAAASARSEASAEPASPRRAGRSALRRWAKAASTTAKTCSRVDLGRRRVASGPGDQTGVDVGGRPEHVATDRSGPAYVGEPRGLDRRDAVDLRAGRRGQPVRDLRLHHHQPPLERGQQRQQVQQHRDRDVVGQVGDERGGRRTGDGGDPQRVGRHHLEAVRLRRRALRDRRREGRGQHRVDLDGHHSRGDVQQGEGQRAEAGPDLEDHVVGTDAGVAHDPAHRVGVDHEVLPALLGRAQVERGGQRTHFCRTEQSRSGGSDGRLTRMEPSRQVSRTGRRTPATRRSRPRRRGPARPRRSAAHGCSRAGRPEPPYDCQVPRLNCRPP